MRAFLPGIAQVLVLSFVSLCVSGSAHAEMVTNPGFEVAESTLDPGNGITLTAFGDWDGDQSTIVTAENGIWKAIPNL